MEQEKSDLIDRQEALDAMNRLREDDLETYGVEIPESFDAERANEAIRNLPSVEPERKKDEWIPCSERLPEENGQYLITVKYEHVDDYEDIYSEHGEWGDGKWDMFSFGHCGKVENIIAWMPLPEPYKGEIKNE